MTRAPETNLPTVADCAELLAEVRRSAPLVQSITNRVVTNFTANALLALGAAPAMVDIRVEAGVFAGVADGLLVNLGSPGEEQRDAAREAVAAAREAGTPWVLDPVAVGVLPVRTAFAHDLLAIGPTTIRGNASEIIALAGAGAGGRGVDATDETDAAADAAFHLAATHGAVVAVGDTGESTSVGDEIDRAGDGDALLTRVTGGGCALGAVMAAFLSTTDDAFVAMVAASLVYTVAADLALDDGTVRGPGTFAPAFLDALANITPNDVLARGRLTATEPETGTH